MARLFVAIHLPREYQDGLAQLTASLKGRLRSRLAWTRPGNWHLTLKFLGDTDETRITAITKALRSVPFTAFDLQAGDAGFFPDMKRPRVFWLGLAQGGDACRALARNIEGALEPLGFAPEARPFEGHLTLARVKQGRGDDWAGLKALARKKEWPVFRAHSFTLQQSELTPQGPKYSVLGLFGAGTVEGGGAPATGSPPG